MLINGSRFANTAVLSLHLGAKVGSIGRPVINPANLRIFAYELSIPSTREDTFLLTSDIREIGSLGVIIDTADELVSRGDVIKLDEMLDIGFPLIGLKVRDTDGNKIGKVDDYTLDVSIFEIQQLSVNPGLIKSLAETSRLINRSQIVDINDKFITVKSAKAEVAAPVLEQSRTAFVNPFRQPAQSPQVDSTSTTSP